MPIKNRFAELLPEITGWRRDIHQNPELLFETHRTSALVADKLREFGCDEVVTGIGRTGVVGVIKGRTDNSGKVVGLRADMDALPIFETTGLDYASSIEGAMHACGHDGHTAMLLGAARYLSETRNFDGTCVVIFQPAEEGGGGGKEMCDDGMMDRWGIREVYGMHNMPGLPAGSFSVRSGAFFASTDTFEVKFRGRGGHAAKPQEAIDTTLMAAHAVMALQTVASRNVDPVKPVVVSVTSFETESKAFNVIPEWVTVRGTVRTQDGDTRKLAAGRVREICDGVAATFGGKADMDYIDGYPVMVNHDAETEHARSAAFKIGGGVADAPILMGGEDFAYMLEERPGAYILIGNGDSAPVHHPGYNFNDEIIPAGCSWWAEIVESRMPVDRVGTRKPVFPEWTVVDGRTA